jgi:trk system potassium uptake protein TrkH
MLFNRVAPVLGKIVLVFLLPLAVPLVMSMVVDDGTTSAYAITMAACALIGLTLLALARSGMRSDELKSRDGILLVGLVWTLLPLIACMPFLLYFAQTPQPLSFSGAYFEAMSALTTTGSTVIVGLDHLPASINLWRCFLQWLGGMGILVLAVAILPLLGGGGSQLFRAEATGPMKDSKLTPRITETAKGLWTVYCLLSLACLFAYRWGGMSWLDAWAHMFTTLSLGGLSTHDASFGFFNSPTLEWTAIVFMLLASCNFALYFVALVKRQPFKVLRDPEWRASMALLVGCSLMIAVLLWFKGYPAELGDLLRMSLFNVISIGSTTGYSTVDYTQWPVFAPIVMLILSGIATSAGSTGAGIKMARLVILLKQARREMRAIIHPRAIQPVTLAGQSVDNRTIFSVLGFMLMYGVTIIGLTLLLLLTDMPFETAFSAVVASVNNMGPGLNEIGPSGNYASLTPSQLWICTLAMLLGRLEILSFLVILTPGFWRK